MKPIRADQLLSRYGYCSRSEARGWIRAGRLTLGGVKVDDPSTRVDPRQVEVSGRPVEHPDGILAALHKPAGYVCSHDAAEGPRIYDLIPPQWLQRNPAATSIGRLDRDATGLILLTDLGGLVQRWTSPHAGVPKRYEVTLGIPANPDWLPLFASGTLRLHGEKQPCRPARLELVDSHRVRLELTEGRFHQVKRMFAAVDAPVVALHRSHFGPFALGQIQVGEWQILPLPEPD